MADDTGQALPPTIPLEAVIECAKSIPLSHRSWVLWAADCAERALPIFEGKYPDDNRPRLAIEAARKGGNSAARAAVRAAVYATYTARAAARAAVRAAVYAAYTARAAARADAVADTAYAAAYTAYTARDACMSGETTWQAIRLLHYIAQESD